MDGKLRKISPLALSIAMLTATASLAGDEKFDTVAPGTLPADWICGVTGKGSPVWKVEADASAPQAAYSISRRSHREAARRPSCSPATRPGASPPTSPSCRSWCVGPEHRATTRHSVISITLTAARRWQPPQRRAEGLLHCYSVLHGPGHAHVGVLPWSGLPRRNVCFFMSADAGFVGG
jgi:hypothetical protein